ncbi:MAG: hypothetical protein PHX60_09485 [Giesbergeria sp.]|uniref:HNH endonuclease signature motif containing protein n=1 Tax=Giesbergeria sp. TaxID=2818473 RepID=UPI00261C0C56|nr:hypothetical protein [Giesbergeria sp.]MDD2609907.1 hypothetical protein [Giesbergeria sp.]
MKLKYDFSALWKIVENLGAAPVPFSLAEHAAIPLIDIELEKGIEVALENLENISGLIAYDGRQVLLYIPDQGRNIQDVLNGNRDVGKKFHVAHCKALEDMKKAGRFERYIATTDTSGIFNLTGSSNSTHEILDRASLYVCQFCLNMLNYKQAKVNKNARQIREAFNLNEFFETYSSCFRHLPSRTHVTRGESVYSTNWSKISEKLRSANDWTCSECSVNMLNHKNLLHVHHINGNKGDNFYSNLKVLCKACHRLQPLHDSLHITSLEMQTINQLRRKNGFFNGTWEQALKYADPAYHGILGIAQSAGWPPPEIQYPFDTIQLSLDVAWPRKKIGLVLSTSEYLTYPSPWKILDLATAANFKFSSSSVFTFNVYR